MVALKQLRAINSRLQSKAVHHFHRNFSLDVLQNPKFAFEYMLRTLIYPFIYPLIKRNADQKSSQENMR